jgi:hypothetical protein
VKSRRNVDEVVVLNIARRFDDENHVSVELFTTFGLRPDSRLILCPIRSAGFHVLAALIRSCHRSLLVIGLLRRMSNYKKLLNLSLQHTVATQ